MKTLFRRPWFIAVFFAATVTHAASTLVEVKPSLSLLHKMEFGGFTFEIKSERTTNGDVKFHVVITEGTQKFSSSNPALALAALTYFTDDKGQRTGYEIGKVGLKPTQQKDAQGVTRIVTTGREIAVPALTAKLAGGVVTCDFVVPESLLTNPDVGVEFTNPVVTTPPDGPSRPMPAQTMYFARLKDFAPPPLLFTEVDADKTVVVPKGAQFFVELAGKASTGYSWTLLWADPRIVTGAPGLSATYISNPGLVGAGGIFAFIFQAEATGTTSLRFGYQRLWEKDAPPEKTFSITVKVE